jgi:hypothetical protein
MKILLLILLISLILITLFLITKKYNTSPQTLLVIVTQAIISQVSYGLFGLVEDEKTYHKTGILLMDSLNAGLGFQNFGVSPGKESFTYILGSLYYIVGPLPIAGIIINIFFLSLIPSILVASCNNFGLPQAGKTTAWVFSLTPSIVFWAAGLRRESLAFLLIVVIILTLSLFYRSRFIFGTIVGLLTFLIIQSTRPQLVLMLIPSLFIVLFKKKWIEIRQNTKTIFTIIITHVTFAWFVFLPSRRGEYEGYIAEISNSEFSTSVMNASWDFNSSPTGYLYNIYRALTGPPVWEWSSKSMFVFGVEGVYYLFVAIITVTMLINKKTQRAQIIILLFCSLPLLLTTSFILGNYGINSRVRAHYLIPLLPILSLFIIDLKDKVFGFKNKRKGVDAT